MKMKRTLSLPKFPQLKLRKRKKLRATAARRPLRIAATAEYNDIAEPNMKLSRALLIVLLLHVVAVSGIIAFNAIKTREAPPSPRSRASAASSADATAVANRNVAAANSPSAVKDTQRHDEAKPRPATKSSVNDRKTDHAKSIATGKHVESGKVYVVAKGDNPAGIAKKLKVSYDELLALNHIDDPHKLQIGQKLLVPAKSNKAKKNDE